MHTANKVYKTNQTLLHFTGTIHARNTGGSRYEACIALWETSSGHSVDTASAILTIQGGTTSTNPQLDISELPDGEYYVGLAMAGGNDYANITKIWFE